VRSAWLRALLIVLALVPSRVCALAKFNVVTMGTGFSDATPVAPVGGNAGTTLGEQRRLALARALEIWGKVLDSAVPIVVEASFRDMGCTENGAVLAQATPERLFGDLPEAEPLWYPSPLADRIAGRDLSPGESDLSIEFNGALDGSCQAQLGGWYYGFDRAAPEQNGLIATALHELAHGLGFRSWVNLSNGALQLPGQLDVFTTHIFDLDLQQSWAQLSNAQRVQSASNVRRVAWDGPQAQRAAQAYLGAGYPSLTLEPSLAGFAGFVSDASGALNPAQHPVRGALVGAQPQHGCAPLSNDVRGAVVLLVTSQLCPWPAAVSNVLSAGGAAALFIVGSSADQPASPLEAVNQSMALPVMALAESDGALLADALAHGRQIVAQLGGQATRLLGADERGRPLLFSPSPVQRGSSISHLDSLARPNLLLEPYSNPDDKPEIDPVTLAIMQDIGWTRVCGNQRLDPGEDCDDGAGNSDATPDACRTSCLRAACGDGVRDRGEACDEGSANSDTRADACRTRCVAARCGDGVPDRGEACDEGAANDDTRPDACRKDCRLAHCGDGVLDTGEACDLGAANDDARADGCRTNCQLARCGDGVIDQGEACDRGADNDDARADACREDCRPARCGDGVRDEGEECDGEKGCSSSCAPSEDDGADPWFDPWASADTAARKKDSSCSLRAPSSSSRSAFALCGLSLMLFARRSRARARARSRS
jgi:hypothetical protein